MTFDEWIENEYFDKHPTGLECVGRERMTQIWDAACAAEREACAKVAESWATAETATTCANIAEAIRRANATVQAAPQSGVAPGTTG